MSAGQPPIEELLPQRGAMRLLDAVLAHDERETRCAADPARAELFRDEDGRVPAWVALELMAQCAAVHGGLAARHRGEPPRAGLFVGARRVRLAADAFEEGRPLEVGVVHVRGERGAVAFDGWVRDGAETELAAGRLAFFVADGVDTLAEEVRHAR